MTLRTLLRLLAAWIFVLALYWVDFGEVSDNRFGDVLLRNLAGTEPPTPIVIVRIDPLTLDQLGPLPFPKAVADRIARALDRYQPLSVVLSDSPGLILADPEAAPSAWLLPGRTMLAGQGIVPAARTIRPDPDGVTRHLYANPDPSTASPAWPFVLLGQFPERDALRVRFAGPPGSFPNLSLSELLNGAAPDVFLRQKHLLLGLDLPEYQAPLVTPVSDLWRPMLAVEFQANALSTLINQKGGAVLSPRPRALLLLVAIILGWGLMWITTLRSNLIIGLLMLGGTLLGGTVSFLFLQILLPVTGLAASVGITLLLSAERKASLLQGRTRRIAENASWELLLRPVPTDRRGLTEEEVWKRLMIFATLHVHPASMALAQPDSSGHRLLFTRFHAMQEGDIREMRRDTVRSPYAGAVSNHEVVRTERYMTDPSLVTFLVPLIYPASLKGFWLVNFRKEGETGPLLHRGPLLLMVGQQAARLLHSAQDALSSGPLKKSMSDSMQRQLHEIERIFQNLIEEKALLYSLLDSLPEGIFLTDMFGRLLHLNHAMRAHLLQRGLDPAQIPTLADLLVRIGAIAPGEEGTRLFKLKDFSGDLTFRAAGLDLTVRMLLKRLRDGEEAPEGFLLLANTSRSAPDQLPIE